MRVFKRCALERMNPSAHGENDDTESEQVADLAVVGHSLQDLGGHVAIRTDELFFLKSARVRAFN